MTNVEVAAKLAEILAKQKRIRKFHANKMRKTSIDTQRMSFAEWCEQVDEEIEWIAGLTRKEVSDCRYHGWFDEGKTPNEAALVALREAGFDGIDKAVTCST